MPTRARDTRARGDGPAPATGSGWPALRSVALGERDGVWSQPPTAAAAVVRYAKEGEWATPGGDLRGLATLYARLVGVTVTVVLYAAAWLVQAPIRRPPGRPPVWATPPVPLADLVVELARGSWCPPAATGRLALGRFYGALVALPVSAALYLAAAIAQRPGRLAAAALLLLIVRIFA